MDPRLKWAARVIEGDRHPTPLIQRQILGTQLALAGLGRAAADAGIQHGEDARAVIRTAEPEESHVLALGQRGVGAEDDEARALSGP